MGLYELLTFSQTTPSRPRKEINNNIVKVCSVNLKGVFHRKYYKRLW
jgi:hypothetical protein